MPKVDRSSSTPLFEQIADDLRDSISRGEYPEGTPLPSETALMAEYDVSRMTVRQALDLLRGEGLIASEHGRGVFVRTRPTVYRLARNRFGRAYRETGKGAYDVEMKSLGLTPHVELVELGPVTPPREIAERLDLRPSDQALIRRRKMYASGRPMQLATSYIPWELAEGTQMTEPETGPGGIYSRLADIDHGPARFVEDVLTRMATRDERRFLQLPSPQPVFYVVRTAFDTSDRPVEVCDHVLSGDRWQLSYGWTAD
jgi:GntR family transcriptional regulator